MDDFEEDDEEINVPLSIPHVILGLLMMVCGLIIPIFLENAWLKGFCGLPFVLSNQAKSS